MRRSLAALLLCLAPAANAAEWIASDEDTAVHQALSVRHFDKDCAAVEALTDTPIPTLLNIVHHATMPPWAPMRAAACLTERHAAEVQGELERWVTDPALLGLGIQTLGLLDRMPEEVAIPVARQALERGPAELDAAKRVGQAKAPAVSGLVTP